MDPATEPALHDDIALIPSDLNQAVAANSRRQSRGSRGGSLLDPAARGDCPLSGLNVEAPEPVNFVENARRFTRFLHNAYLDQDLCDVILQTNSSDLLAHRVVLAASSPSLNILFRQTPPTGDTVAHINVTDFSRDAVGDVINFAYTGDLRLDNKNIGPVASCARQLDFEIVVRICQDYLIEAADPENIVLHYSVAANNDFAEQRERLQTVICDAFPEISRNRHFLYLPMDRLMSILSSSKLCAEELDIFNAIVRWIDAQRSDRLPLAGQLLKYVRFQLIDPETLIARVQTVDWLFANRECHEQVLEAFKFHALKSINSRYVNCLPIEEQRNCAVQTTGPVPSRPSSVAGLPVGQTTFYEPSLTLPPS